MDPYQSKYLKYKEKYLALKKLLGGSEEFEEDSDREATVVPETGKDELQEIRIQVKNASDYINTESKNLKNKKDSLYAQMKRLSNNDLVKAFQAKEAANSEELEKTLKNQTLKEYVTADYKSLSKKLEKDRGKLQAKSADDAAYNAGVAAINQQNLKLKIAAKIYDIQLNLVSFNVLKKLNSSVDQGVVKGIYVKQLENLSERNAETLADIEKLVAQLK